MPILVQTLEVYILVPRLSVDTLNVISGCEVYREGGLSRVNRWGIF